MNNFVIILSHPSHAGNIGAAARAMKTMGLKHLRLVCPRVDYLNEEAVLRARSGVGILKNAQVFENLSCAIADCQEILGFSSRQRELTMPIFALSDVFSNLDFYAPTALLFGNETNGLHNDELMLCTKHVFIPTSDEFSSLNLACAVQIACYECLQFQNKIKNQNQPQKALKRKNLPKKASAQERAHLIQSFEHLMLHSGFYNPKDPGRLLFRLTRLFNRIDLEKTEAHILEGIVHSIFNPTAHRK